MRPSSSLTVIQTYLHVVVGYLHIVGKVQQHFSLNMFALVWWVEITEDHMCNI